MTLAMFCLLSTVPVLAAAWLFSRFYQQVLTGLRSHGRSFRLAKRPPSQLSRNPASRDSVVGSSARKGTPITSRRTSSAPPPPPNQIRAAPAAGLTAGPGRGT